MSYVLVVGGRCRREQPARNAVTAAVRVHGGRSRDGRAATQARCHGNDTLLNEFIAYNTIAIVYKSSLFCYAINIIAVLFEYILGVSPFKL